MIDGVVTKKLIKHNDERVFFEELIRVSDEFFKEGFGQLSHSLMYPGVIKAWHIHKSQVDWWFVAYGTLKVALFDLREKSPTFRKLAEMGEKTAELFYVTSKVYNTEEEGRILHDDPKIGYDWSKM